MFPCRRPDPFRRTDGRTAATVSFNGAFLAAVAVVVGRSAGQAIQDSFGEPQSPIAFLVIIMYKLRNWLDKKSTIMKL